MIISIISKTRGRGLILYTTSPNASIRVTDIKIEAHAGRSASMKIGKACRRKRVNENTIGKNFVNQQYNKYLHSHGVIYEEGAE